MEIENLIIDGIPTLTCFNNDGAPKPLVILSHPFQASKVFWQDRLERLANMGYYGVALDNRGHGERGGADFAEQVIVEGKFNVYEVRRLMKETADDIPKLIDYFVKNEEVDESRIGMTGLSMGGYITFRALVIEKRIKVAVAILASPYFNELPKDVQYVDRPEVLKALETYSHKNNPANFIDRFYPKALLIQVGALDKHFDVNRVKGFYHELRNRYQDAPHCLEFVMENDIAHEFTQNMWKNTLDWLQKHL